LYDVIISLENEKKFIRRRIYFLSNKVNSNEECFCVIHFFCEGNFIEKGLGSDFNEKKEEKNKQRNFLIGNKSKRSFVNNFNNEINKNYLLTTKSIYIS
jgi:hypothetical protein